MNREFSCSGCPGDPETIAAAEAEAAKIAAAKKAAQEKAQAALAGAGNISEPVADAAETPKDDRSAAASDTSKDSESAAKAGDTKEGGDK